MLKTLIVLFGLLLLAGCGDKLEPVSTESVDAGINGKVTYTEHIKPLLDSECTSCHDWLGNYQDAKKNAERSNRAIQNGAMPPSNGLSASDRALFQRWIDDGTLE